MLMHLPESVDMGWAVMAVVSGHVGMWQVNCLIMRNLTEVQWVGCVK